MWSCMLLIMIHYGTCSLLLFFFFFQQIVNQIDQESDRCDNEEEKSDGEISEERYR